MRSGLRESHIHQCVTKKPRDPAGVTLRRVGFEASAGVLASGLPVAVATPWRLGP